MDERAALLAAILGSSEDDTPRSIFADWCEDNGDPIRAAFIRGQISGETVEPQPSWIAGWDDLGPHSAWSPRWSRGFVSEITCTWAEWRKFHLWLYWHPAQEVDCPVCKGMGWVPPDRLFCVACRRDAENRQKREAGKVDRLFTSVLAETCQPLQRVRLTSFPGREVGRHLLLPDHPPLFRESNGFLTCAEWPALEFEFPT